MKRWKKLLILHVSIFAVLAVAITGLVIYAADHPRVQVLRARGNGMEMIGMTYSGRFHIHASDKAHERMQEVMDWSEAVVYDEYQIRYEKPYDLKVYGEIKDGKTKIWYEGTGILPDGKTEEFYREKTFDYVLCSQKDLLA